MPAPTAPVPVLLHGFLGFEHFGPITYFRGVQRALAKEGLDLIVPMMPPAGSIHERADVLARVLMRSSAASFALFGHSMGGLDGRYLISKLDPDYRVKSLVTVGTPHRGSAVAGRLLEARGLAARVARRHWGPALDDLAPETRAREIIPDRAGVAYSSFAGVRPGDEIPLLLRPFARQFQAPNDGLVPLSSAQWGDFRGTVRSDHLELVGWSVGLPNRTAARPFDHLAFWRRIIRDAIAPVTTGDDA
jgi:triacylglycerol lipase